MAQVKIEFARYPRRKMADALSAYERQRAETISRNRAFLVNLGIDKPLIPVRPAAPKARKRKVPVDDESAVERRTTPRRSARGGGADAPYRPKEESASDTDDDEEYVAIPRPRAIKKAQAASAPAPDVEGSAPCIVVEAAKTGRSKCRRCLELLAASALRVGMEVRRCLRVKTCRDVSCSTLL